MKVIVRDRNTYLLRGDRGDNLLEEIKKFCTAEGIKAGVFHAIGAAENVRIGWYDITQKRYVTKDLEGSQEIDFLFGTIALLNGEVLLHSHGIFSDRDMRTQGGDVKNLAVSAIAEVFLETLEGRVEKKFSEEIGLNVMEEPT